jgi:hypothetical protein
MSLRRAIRYFFFITAVAACVVAFAAPVFSQCAMCRASLGSNSSFLKSFNIGVLVLLVPPVTMFCTIFIVAIRHRKSL